MDDDVYEVRIQFYNKKGEQVPMSCCGPQGKKKPPKPPKPPKPSEPPPQQPPETNPPGSIPETPVPPGTPVPPEELPPSEPSPEPPPVEPPPPDPIIEPDPIPPGDPVPPPPDPEEPPPPPPTPGEEPDPTLPPPSPPTLPDPPPESNEFNKILGTTSTPIISYADIVIPNGESWRFVNVEIKGSIRTEGTGTFAMRPGDRVKFFGNNADDYVGGGATWSAAFAKDYGIWITPGGKFDVRGTPKVSWTRFGMDASWAASNEMYVAPTAIDDFAPRRWFQGDTVPQVHSTLPAAEVMNVTRDITIEGGHIHIASNAAHRVEYFQMIGMGISNVASRGTVLGRYCLHLHHSGDMGGLIIKGVSAVGAKGHVFVPHGCSNLTFEDCVTVNSFGMGFFWDHGHKTDNIMVNRLCVSGVHMPDEISGEQSNMPGVNLGAGVNMTMKNSAVSGCQGGAQATGFSWPEPTALFDNAPDLVWTFEPANVAHNNAGDGVRFWTNRGDAHVVRDYKSYRNKGPGITNGAYFVGTEYHNVYTYQDGTGNYNNDEIAGLLYSGNSTLNTEGNPGQVKNSILGCLNGPALKIGHRQLDFTVATLIENVKLIPGTDRAHVLFGPGGLETKPGLLHFVGCTDESDDPLTPAHFDILTRPGFETEHDGSVVKVYYPTIGTLVFTLTITNGEFVVS